MQSVLSETVNLQGKFLSFKVVPQCNCQWPTEVLVKGQEYLVILRVLIFVSNGGICIKNSWAGNASPQESLFVKIVKSCFRPDQFLSPLEKFEI